MFELQYFFIGFIQGITEFLPISSSAHLILISKLTSWQDQGIFTDICVHVGTLGAVIFYLRIDIKNIILDFFNFNKSNFFAIKIIIATIPAVIIGYLVYEYFILYLRNIEVIAWASIFFGILLFVSDRNKDSNKKWEDLNYFEIIIRDQLSPLCPRILTKIPPPPATIRKVAKKVVVAITTVAVGTMTAAAAIMMIVAAVVVAKDHDSRTATLEFTDSDDAVGALSQGERVVVRREVSEGSGLDAPLQPESDEDQH